MVTETEDDAEGALLEAAARRGRARRADRRRRSTCTPTPRVRMAKNANALVSYRTYPHIDGYERAVQAAALVQEAMEGKKKPRCLLVQPAMLEGAEHGRTTQPGLMLDLLAKADALREGAGHQRGQHPGRLHLGRHSLYRPVGGGELRAARPRRAPGDRARADRRDLAAARRGRDDLLSPDRRRHRRGARRVPASRGRWSSPTAPTIRAAAATTTPRPCCRRCSTPASRTWRSARSTIRRPCSRRPRRASASEIEVSLGGHTDAVDGRAGQGQGHRRRCCRTAASGTTGR